MPIINPDTEALYNLSKSFIPKRNPNETFEVYRERRKTQKCVLRFSQKENFFYKFPVFVKNEVGGTIRLKGKTYTNPTKNSFKSKKGHKAEVKALKRFKQRLCQEQANAIAGV